MNLSTFGRVLWVGILAYCLSGLVLFVLALSWTLSWMGSTLWKLVKGGSPCG